MKIGVCYYPEHWPQSRWPEDAEMMRACGIEVVRIGEFAWQQMEPAADQLQFQWLHQAMDVLHEAGLKIVLGTPTATPPKWLLDKHPDMLAVDHYGRPRGFGSRRHYCFSSTAYLQECRRIVERLAQEFSSHPGLFAWQTDNEYGCHNTSISYSDNARKAFRRWCKQTYQQIDTLNEAWGNAFWSMNVASFDEIELPNLTVTEANPSHQIAFWRFSSSQVRQFNKQQVDIIRQHSDCPVSHNFMGNFVEFDHREVAADLDIATWDSYPLGFLDRDGVADPSTGAATGSNQPSHPNQPTGANSNRVTEKEWSAVDPMAAWYRTGHPDTAAFHHDLYRGLCNGRWWVMEQQPGPVNWAPHNPSPLPGMVRLWGLEAFAHGAEVVSYFRWRQAPSAQEQMHTGLLLSDGTPDVAAAEVTQLSKDIEVLQQLISPPHSSNTASDKTGSFNAQTADVALVFDYSGDCALRVQRPGGDSGLHGMIGGRFDPLGWAQSVYSALRSCGQSVDIVGTDADFSGYKLVVVGCAGVASKAFAEALSKADTQVLILPRSGSKTLDCTIPDRLPPGELQALIPLKVVRSESLPGNIKLEATAHHARSNSLPLTCCDWRERIDTDLAPSFSFDDGWGLHYQHGKTHYLNAWLDAESLQTFIKELLQQSGVTCIDCPPGLRLRTLQLRAGIEATGAVSPVEVWFACNYGPFSVDLRSLPGMENIAQKSVAGEAGSFLIGSATLEPADVAVWTAAPSAAS